VPVVENMEENARRLSSLWANLQASGLGFLPQSAHPKVISDQNRAYFCKVRLKSMTGKGLDPLPVGRILLGVCETR
jgi:hypothetical protein